jgi:hypothetical protein
VTAQFTIAADPPTPAQRVKLLANPRETSWVWLCACGRNGRPWPVAADAFMDWEGHRTVCVLRPAGETS